jgi:succinyl-CoA:mesaconate CoA transferase
MSALDDLRVLDLTRILGGPYCTMLLADLGADVVKIEPPGGDIVRSTPPFCEDREAEPYGGYFQSINRGKRSLQLDFREERDRQHFLDLAEKADVVVENFRPGTMTKFDLDYETLRERNPGLVYASLRGYGDPRTKESPNQRDPAYDLIVQAKSGIMHLNGQADGPPTKFGLGIGDIFTGVVQAVGVLAAVHHRERTGEGQFVDVSMYDCMVSLAERTVYQYSYTDEVPKRQGNTHPTFFPYDGFETADGYVVIAALTDGQWRVLCEKMDRPDLAADYPDDASRIENRAYLREQMAEWAAEHTTEEILATLDGDVPAAPIQDVADVFEDDHVDARDMLLEVDQPGTDETVHVAGTPIKMTETPPSPGERAPLLDEHREELLAEIGALDGDDGSEPARQRTDGGSEPE